MLRRRRLLFLAASALALTAAGCGGGGNEEATPTATGPASTGTAGQSGGMMSADTGAELSVVAPEHDAVVSENSVPAQLSISNFKIDCGLAGTANRKGVGHYHIELDRALVNMFCEPSAQVSLQNVPPGKHTLEFVPAENDHAEDMDAAQEVSFDYQPSQPLPEIGPASFPGKPSIQITAPADGDTVSGSFDFTVAVENFRLSCDLYGKPNIAGYGHWHANVDTTTEGMMGMATMLGMSCAKTFHVSLEGIKPGQHRFFAILEDNQHAPTIGATDSVTVTVK